MEPFASKPFLQLALLEERLGDYDRALAYLDDAKERDLGDWRLALVEARVRQRAGDIRGAKAVFARVARFMPLITGSEHAED